MNHFLLGLMLVGLMSGTNKDVYQTGTASYYANKFEGRKTASGEIFRQDSLTAAHKSLPFGTMLKVTNLSNDSVVIVKVNDRIGTSSRVIDLSLKAAQQLNFVKKGLTKVTLEKI
jgi:rare lipoprotein A